jgi:glycosyltransferase involved in cell wall biosynthesis
MATKQLLFLISSLGSGGAERQTIDLVNSLDRSRFDVSVAHFVRNETLKPLLQKDRLTGLHCLDKRMRFDPGALMRLKAIVQKTKPDIVVCVNPYPAVYIYLLRLIYGFRCKVVVVMHSTLMPDRYTDALARLLYRPLLNRADKVIFVCWNQMKYWQTTYRINEKICHYIYNGIDTERFTCQMDKDERISFRKSLGIGTHETVICICATLAPTKRHVDLIDAGASLRNRGFQLKILIVGDGPERKNIEKHIKGRGVEGSVIFVGFQPDVRPFVEISDIFAIVSSSIETFSIAILEAMSMSKAIIASDIGCASEQILNNENGYLFQAKNVNALSEKLYTLLKSKRRNEMGEMSRKIVKKNFCIEKMVYAYENILDS